MQSPLSVLIIGVGAFTHGLARTLQDAGANVIVWLSRDYGHYGPQQSCATYDEDDFASPIELLDTHACDIMIPMSIDWAQQTWARELCARIAVFCPSGDALLIERDRAFAQHIGEEAGIVFPRSFVAQNRLDAQDFLDTHPDPYVIKNTLCSPTSPIHTIVCETLADTQSWLDRIDYAEGVFFQEYMGHKEAGHIVFVQNGNITSLVSNQEYKRAFNGNMGKIAGAPLGGLIEADPDDKYDLAKKLIAPLQPWLKQVNYTGPLQVTAILKNNIWSVIEYNSRLGVTCGPMIMRMLNNPLDMLKAVIDGSPFIPDFKTDKPMGCSITLAGYGYPFLEVTGPAFPLTLPTALSSDKGDVWLNEVKAGKAISPSTVLADGHRLLDVNAFGQDKGTAVARAYALMQDVGCSNSYYRTDIGDTMWPPGAE
ncbi:MAG: phosphoribosylamine--glycine ligase [Glaciecola sp.]|nr:phosphoribosylamine--glycine ligase [Glaciecola sp.]MDG1467587.1 phosphoribosylamine--glycine ligase [Glaciecola sp.]